MSLEQFGMLYQTKDTAPDTMLNLIDKVTAAKTKDTAPKYDQVNTIGDLREDVVIQSMPPDKVFANAAAHDGKYFITPRVVD